MTLTPQSVNPAIDPERLILDHLNLATSIASQIWRQAPSALERDELLGLANLGLVQAAHRWGEYCEAEGYSPHAVSYFIPFAQRRIRGAIFDKLRQNDHATRSVRTKAKKLAAAGAGQGATPAELSERTGLTPKEIRDTMTNLDRKPVSIEAAEREPVLRDVEAISAEAEVLFAMTAAIELLSPVHQVILALHYYEEMELQSIAVLLGITESRASHFHTEAVLQVHAVLEAAVVDSGLAEGSAA